MIYSAAADICLDAAHIGGNAHAYNALDASDNMQADNALDIGGNAIRCLPADKCHNASGNALPAASIHCLLIHASGASAIIKNRE
jgi:hypothetical protein